MDRGSTTVEQLTNLVERRDSRHNSSLPLLNTQVLRTRNKKRLINLQLRNLNPESIPS